MAALSDAEVEAQFTVNGKYSETKTPTFLVDFGASFKFTDQPYDPKATWDWKIVEVQKLTTADKRVLLDQGWAAVSYAYGAAARKAKVQRPNYDPSAANIPLAANPEIRSKILTCFPQILYPKVDPKNDKEVDKFVFHLDEAKAIFWLVKKRFLWWDMACVPQEDRTDPTSVMPPVRKTANGKEVSKQKFVYGPASTGIVWLLQADFTDTKNVNPLKTLFTRSPPFDIKDLEKGIPTAVDALKWLMALLGPQSIESFSTLVEALQTFIFKTLDAVTQSDRSFSSLWCFQESKLMGPQIFVDKKGNRLNWSDQMNTDSKNTFTHTKVDDGRTVLRPGIPALTAIATFLATELSLAITSPKDARLPDVLRDANIKKAGADRTDGAIWLEILLKRLARSGLIYFPENSPLELIIAARRNRPTEARYPKNKYDAMIGVLDIVANSDFKEDLTKDPKIVRPGAYDGDALQASKQFFLDNLARYQWRMLQVAKLNKRLPEANKDLSRQVEDPVTRVVGPIEFLPSQVYESWASISEGLFEPVRAYCQVFEQDRGLGNITGLPSLVYDVKEDVINVAYGPIAAPTKNLTLSKLTGAQKITAYQLEIDHLGSDRSEEAKKQAGEFVLADLKDIKDYTNFKFNPGVSNYVSVDTVPARLLTQDGRPGEVFLKLHDLPNAAEKDTAGKPFTVARYVAIRLTPQDLAAANAAGAAKPAPALSGTFEGIVDITGATFTDVQTPYAKLRWQETGANKGVDCWEPVAAKAKDSILFWKWIS